MKEIIVTMSEIIILKFKQGRVQQKRVFKVTWYLWCKNRQLLDILTCNSANIPWFIS